MKNIHLLPTEKPSRLYKSKITQNISMGPIDISQHGDATYNLIIYITSDEEIKEGDWVVKISSLYKGGGNVQKYSFIDTQFEDITFKKIILTTDQDLIADGIQAIDDEFLEWFVKNPTCEFVKVRKRFSEFTVEPFVGYEIIIPQEEPKQETLEEYSNGLYKQSLKDDVDLTFSDGVKLGAKWQSERMYSEEEVEKIISKLMNEVHSGDICYGDKIIDFKISPKKWFEQFKKK